MNGLLDKRSLLGTPALMGILLVGVLIAGCSVTETLEPKVELGPGVVVPTSWVTPVERCLLDRGFVATAVVEGDTGTNEKFDYSWSTKRHFVWEGPAGTGPLAFACEHALGDDQTTLTPDEIAEVYDRWVKERLCLVDLGITVPSPPTLDEFQRTWVTGPWTPGDTIRIPSRQVLDTCGLEMLR